MSILIVLGGPINDNLTPGIWLTSRLEKTIEIYPLLNPNYIIVTGGDTKKLGKAEAHIMKEYLVKKCIPSDKIYCETKSINTIQNGEFTYKMLKNFSTKIKIYVLTSEFHSNRAQMIFQYYYKNFAIIMINAITPISDKELEQLKKNDIILIDNLKKYLHI